MGRAINVQIFSDLSDTDEALRSVLSRMKHAGYDYVDYKIMSNEDTPEPEQMHMQMHAMLYVTEPDAEGADKLPLDGAKPDPVVEYLVKAKANWGKKP